MKKLFLQFRSVTVLLLALLALAVSGCASMEPENASVRPWNSPKGWETGFPSSMSEGR